jgi:hypothetical protein
MNAHVRSITDRRPVKIALLRFGKLVLEPTGAVHFDAGYAVTYKTPDFVGNGKCLPDALLGGLQLNDTHVEPQASRDGGLLLRLVPLDGGDRVVAMRARLRPEAGDGHGGRGYVQATVVQTVTGDGWAAMPASFPARCAETLRAEPDLFSVPLAERSPGFPLDLEPDDVPAPTLAELAALPGRRRARLVSIARAIMEARPLVVGMDGFDPDEPGPEDARSRARLFFEAVGKALAFLRAERVSIPDGLVLAAGFASTILPGSVRLLAGQCSAPGLDDDLSALEAALARHVAKPTGPIAPWPGDLEPAPIAGIVPASFDPGFVPAGFPGTCFDPQRAHS